MEAASDRPGDLLHNAILENIGRTVTRLKTLEPVLTGLVSAGTVSVVGAHYDLVTGFVTPIA